MRTAGLWLGACLVLGLATAWGGEELQQGDWVVVKVEKAPLKLGSEIVAWINKGQRARVMAVQGGYALIPYNGPGGEITDAYIKLTDIEKEAGAAQPERKAVETTYHEDDVVVVVGKDAKLMMSKEVLGTIPPKTRLTVKKVNDKWLYVCTPVDGKDTWGWVSSRDVDYPSVRDKGGDKPPEKSPEKPPEKGGEGK